MLNAKFVIQRLAIKILALNWHFSLGNNFVIIGYTKQIYNPSAKILCDKPLIKFYFFWIVMFWNW